MLAFRDRLYCLMSLEEMLIDFYIPFSKRVAQPYSPAEEDLIVRVIGLLTTQIDTDSPYSCKNKICNCYLTTYVGSKSYFRLALPACDPFSIQVRTDCLYVLGNRLHCLFANRGSSRYSEHERKILKRVRKLLIHQLVNTSKYDLFKSKRTPRMTEEEAQELKWQRTDEKRLKNVALYHYNPLSQKYKLLKEELLEELKQKSGEE